MGLPSRHTERSGDHTFTGVGAPGAGAGSGALSVGRKRARFRGPGWRRALAGRTHGHLQEDHLSVLGRWHLLMCLVRPGEL